MAELKVKLSIQLDGAQSVFNSSVVADAQERIDVQLPKKTGSTTTNKVVSVAPDGAAIDTLIVWATPGDEQITATIGSVDVALDNPLFLTASGLIALDHGNLTLKNATDKDTAIGIIVLREAVVHS